jgi:cyanophycinase
MNARSFGLLGSGEFEPWSAEVDRWLLARASRTGPVLISPAAAAPEGEDVFRRWAEQGLEHYARAGIPAEILELRTRDDAFRDDLVLQLDRASMVFFSGGNPAYLAATLAESPFWAALLSALDEGLAYGGCSAGVASIGERAPDSRAMNLSEDAWHDGLQLFPDIVFGPHWDVVDSYRPGMADAIARSVPAGSRLFTIDERTAALGDGEAWEVIGSGAVRILESGSWRTYPAGESFDLSPTAARERSEEPA